MRKNEMITFCVCALVLVVEGTYKVYSPTTKIVSSKTGTRGLWVGSQKTGVTPVWVRDARLLGYYSFRSRRHEFRVFPDPTDA